MILNAGTNYYHCWSWVGRLIFHFSHHADSIMSHFTDLREVLGPHLDLLLHELLPVESFVLQSFLRLLPPPPLLLQHLTASHALSFLQERAFIYYVFDLWKGFAEHAEPELGFTFIHSCTFVCCWPPCSFTTVILPLNTITWKSNGLCRQQPDTHIQYTIHSYRYAEPKIDRKCYLLLSVMKS